MKNITNPVRVGRVRRTSISSNLVEDQSSAILRQQTNHDLLIKQNTSRRISRSAPLRDELQDQKQTSTIKTSINNRPNDGTNSVKTKEQGWLNTQTTTTRNLNEIGSKSAWSLKKKIIVGVSATAVAAGLIIVPTVLGVLLTRSTATTTNTTTTTVSSTVISAYWSFDNTIADRYGVYNGQLMNGAGFSPNTSNQPYVGSGRTLFANSSTNESFVVATPFLDLTFKSFTIEAWIYPTLLSTDRGIFGQCQCATCSNQCLFFIIRGTRLYVGFTSNDLYGTTSLTTNNWYHVAFVYNYQTQQQILYINGVQDTITSNAQAYQGQNGSIQIGSTQVYGATNYFNGYIDNVMVTTRAKSASELLSDASLMAYYSFDLPNPTVDNGPNGLSGTSTNGLVATGRVNNAMRFISAGAYFQSYGFYQLPYGVTTNKPFSISLWINPSYISSSTIIQMFGTNFGFWSCTNLLGTYLAAGVNAEIVVGGINSYPAILTGPYVTSNTWTHISVTFSLTNGFSLYVNGIFYGNTGYTTIGSSGTLAYLFIGYYTSCTNFFINVAYIGAVDEAYIHNRELTQSDVTTLANP